MRFQLDSPMRNPHVLYGEGDREWPAGATSHLKARSRGHGEGRARSTESRLPPLLVYHEGCRSREDAFRRERCVETGKGRRCLRQPLAGERVSASRQKWERH